MEAIPSGMSQRSVTRRLTRRYVLALSIVALLSILGQVTVQVLLAQQTDSARIISTAALQITLGERIAKDVLAIQGSHDPYTTQLYATELTQTLTQWRATQLGLQYGDPSQNLPGNNSAAVSHLYSAVAPSFNQILDAATSILVVVNAQPPIPQSGQPTLASNILLGVQTVELENASYVSGMNAVVAQYQREAEEHVATLQVIEYLLLGSLLAVLLALAVVVFRPAVRQVGESIGELVRAEERERELAALKDQFIIDANHELRTPIMALYNNLEILQALGERAGPGQRAMLVQRALAAGDAVLRLLTNVLDTSALEGKPPKLDVRSIALAPLVREVLETFDPREIGEPGLPKGAYEGRPVSVSVPADLTITADEARLRQILINLLANALKYSAPGTPLEIHAVARQSSSHAPQLAQISVRDQGLGVPPEDVHKLFNRFVRLERDIAGPVRGTGVGLYVCRVLVEAMGGQIWVESTGVPGAGSTFSFTLPLAPSLVPVGAGAVTAAP